MQRYFMDIAYLGTAYSGWQVQANAPSVQAEIERALGILAGREIRVTGSGRTDSGVHALQQCCHVDFSGPVDTGQYRYRLNALLPKDICVLDLRPVQPDAHARYSALSRAYLYRITTRKDPFLSGRAHYFPWPLDPERLNEASALLTGYHDFQAMSKYGANVRHYFCDVYSAEWVRKEQTVEFRIRANRFLWGMVRALVGSMLPIGEGKAGVESLAQMLGSGDRRKAGEAAPPHGLYLSEVRYPEEIFLPG
jgi:tRNA pseudouridine38-40 synthase